MVNTCYQRFSGQTVDAVTKLAAEDFAVSGSESPSLDAAVLLCHVIQKPRSYLFTWPDAILEDDQLKAFLEVYQRRLSGEPIAYIVGEREFWSLPLKVSPETLIPRPDTERLVELALDKAQLISGPILDLGTGTGAIALALASELPDRAILGVDLKPEAQQLAQENAANLSLPNAKFLSGSWFSPIDSGTKFALIVSNPPYIDENDPHLVEGDVRFEPKSALVADENGLADITQIIQASQAFLLDQGWLMFEHGFQQGKAVRDIFAKYNFTSIHTEQDYTGLDRVTMGQFHVQ